MLLNINKKVQGVGCKDFLKTLFFIYIFIVQSLVNFLLGEIAEWFWSICLSLIIEVTTLYTVLSNLMPLQLLQSSLFSFL